MVPQGFQILREGAQCAALLPCALQIIACLPCPSSSPGPAHTWLTLPCPTFPSLPPLPPHRYPIGGDTISVTAGVVSRIEVTDYTHGSTDLLAIQVRTPPAAAPLHSPHHNPSALPPPSPAQPPATCRSALPHHPHLVLCWVTGCSTTIPPSQIDPAPTDWFLDQWFLQRHLPAPADRRGHQWWQLGRARLQRGGRVLRHCFPGGACSQRGHHGRPGGRWVAAVEQPTAQAMLLQCLRGQAPRGQNQGGTPHPCAAIWANIRAQLLCSAAGRSSWGCAKVSMP